MFVSFATSSSELTLASILPWKRRLTGLHQLPNNFRYDHEKLWQPLLATSPEQLQMTQAAGWSSHRLSAKMNKFMLTSLVCDNKFRKPKMNSLSF